MYRQSGQTCHWWNYRHGLTEVQCIMTTIGL